MSRKVANLNKDISKGIKQLIGATRTITRGQSIFSVDNKEIIFERALLLHGIILVSELLPFGDWKETLNTILQAMLRTKISIHVMDMSEYIKFVGYSKGDKNQFDYFLTQRIENFIKNPSMINNTEFING
ncbi:hypothetical protein [Dyadobacter sp. CY356]|uniref:hypothetical protein n=1 Tax=Dyadobacter sp. CY356 TaxID=2906442 RepID=UPI001F287EAF|nr:hypothetical protein [Dyadobacter sp. CY356]MCF0057681.1 hypothetical protein [Dyadobacter sp. CY356]